MEKIIYFLRGLIMNILSFILGYRKGLAAARNEGGDQPTIPPSIPNTYDYTVTGNASFIRQDGNGTGDVIFHGAQFGGTIKPYNGNEITSVNVTMGGVDYSYCAAENLADGDGSWLVLIGSVTGDIVITITTKASARDVIIDVANHEQAEYSGIYATNAFCFHEHDITVYLGKFDLSSYSSIEVTYGSDSKAKLEEGSDLICITNGAVASKVPSENIASVKPTNGTGAGGWDGSSRTAVIDLEGVTYSGDVYLAYYINNGGITVISVKFIAQ